MDMLQTTSTRPTAADRALTGAQVADPTLEATTSTADTSTDDTGADAPTTTADAPATTPHVSRGGLLMKFLQRYEDSHPDEAKAFLSGIADKLRADAEHAGPWSNRLNAWADKFDAAAESGDLSGLAPSRQHAHFGMRAYQRAQGSGEDLSDIARSVPVNGSLTITRTTTTTTTITRSGPAAAQPSEPKPAAPPSEPAAAAGSIAPNNSIAPPAQPSKTNASDVAAPDGTPIITGTAA